MNAPKKVCFSILLFPIVFLAIGILLIVTSYSSRQGYKAAVEVRAVVTKCEHHMDYDEENLPDDSYKIYISYTFEDIQYSDIYWKESNNSMRPGETVRVKISPSEPDKPLDGDPIWIMVGGFLFALAGLILSFKMIPQSFDSEKAIFAPSDTPDKRRKGRWFALVPAAIAIVFLALGLNISPYFHLGTIIGAYFTVVFLEMFAS